MHSPGALFERLCVVSSEFLGSMLYRIGTVGESSGDSWTVDMGSTSVTLTFLPRFTATVLRETCSPLPADLLVASNDNDRFRRNSPALVNVFLLNSIGDAGGVGSTEGKSR